MRYLLTAKMLWPDGSEGGGEDDVEFDLSTPDGIKEAGDFIAAQAEKIGLADFDGSDEVCDAIDLTLSAVDR